MIACVSIPYFAAAVERRALAPLAETPLAIGGRSWEAKPIFAFSQEVARQGVKAGMSLRLAHVMSPEAHFLPATKPRYAQASGEIVDVLLDFSPLVEPQELWHPFSDSHVQFSVDGRFLPARYFLDFDNLPAGESLRLAQAMGSYLRDETDFAPAVGLAHRRFAAQVAATLSRPNHARLVQPGEDAGFLADRPIAFLPLEGETLRRLRLLGIRTLGDLARLPRASLVGQFGPAIEPLHRLASGQDAADSPAVTPRRPQPHAQQLQCFDPPLADRLVLEATVKRLVARLARGLQDEGQEARQLYLAWELEDGRRDQNTVTLRRASSDATHLTNAWLELLAGLIGAWEAAGDDRTEDGRPLVGLEQITLGSRDLVPAVARQLSLFDRAAAEAGPEVWQALRTLIERHKTGGFFRPVLTEADHPLPERRFQLHPFTYDATLA